MVLLGHNGAGKTTLIQYLLGFYTDISQHPFLPGFSRYINKKKIEIRDYSYAPEAALIDHEMSANDYFKMMAGIKGVSNVDVDLLLKKVSLDIDKNIAIKKYSKGMKQRLLLAFALIGEPEYLMLDEPTSGLDPYGKEAIEELLFSLKNDHKFIISTHSLELALRLEDDIWILKKGDVAFEGKVSDMDELKVLVNRYKPEQIL